jgi:hypothetical protein
VDPRIGLDDTEKKIFLTLPVLELRPPVVRPVASRYTDYVIPAPKGSVVAQLNQCLGTFLEE